MVEEGSQGPLWVEIHIVDSLFFFLLNPQLLLWEIHIFFNSVLKEMICEQNFIH